MKKDCLYCLHEVKGYCVQRAMRIDKVYNKEGD